MDLSTPTRIKGEMKINNISASLACGERIAVTCPDMHVEVSAPSGAYGRSSVTITIGGVAFIIWRSDKTLQVAKGVDLGDEYQVVINRFEAVKTA